MSKETVQSLHAEYCLLYGERLALTLERLTWWDQYQKRGFTKDDLRLVFAHIRKGIKTGRRFQGALKFSNLIVGVDRFEEELIEARAEQRNLKPPPSPKTVVEQQLRPTTSEKVTDNTKSVSELIAELKRSAGMNV